VEHYITQANRQNLGFEHPVAAFARAKTRELNRHDAARIEQKNTGMRQSKAEIMANQKKWEAECRDREAMRHYEHHFTDMRGANTVKRANIVVKKVE
jgi:ribosomal protein L20A (L18A)